MISTFTISNYKCFEHQPFELGRLNLLAGLNGAGKSSVIQSLLLLRQSFEQGILVDIGLALNGDYVQIGTAKDALYEKAADDSFGFSLAYGSAEAADWRFVYDADKDVVSRASAPVADSVFQEALFSDSFEYLQAERTGPRTSFPISDYFVRQKKRLGNAGQFATHFLSFFGRKIKVPSALCHERGQSVDLIDQVEAWMSDISPSTRIHTTPYVGMDEVTLEYSFAYGNETTKHYRATNVGFGITFSLPVIVAILSAEPGALILLENPEAHLNPSGQVMVGTLLAMLANFGAQVVVETHSDHLLNGIRLALHGGKSKSDDVKLYYFRRDMSKGICPTSIFPIGLDQNGRLTSRPRGFFDEFSRSLDQLLEPPTKYGDSANS